jgi:flagellar protein FlaG
MVGEFAPATAAPAKTPAPSVARSEQGRPTAAAAGNNVAAGGGNLPPPPPPVDVKGAVARLNEIMSSTRRSLHFQVDESSGRTVITVINEKTSEVVRQIPSEEVLALARSLEAGGSLIDALA